MFVCFWHLNLSCLFFVLKCIRRLLSYLLFIFFALSKMETVSKTLSYSYSLSRIKCRFNSKHLFVFVRFAFSLNSYLLEIIHIKSLEFRSDVLQINSRDFNQTLTLFCRSCFCHLKLFLVIQ